MQYQSRLLKFCFLVSKRPLLKGSSFVCLVRKKWLDRSGNIKIKAIHWRGVYETLAIYFEIDLGVTSFPVLSAIEKTALDREQARKLGLKKVLAISTPNRICCMRVRLVEV